MLGHPLKFARAIGVGATVAIIGFGVHAATTTVTIQVTNDPLPQEDPAVADGRVAYTEYVTPSNGDIVVYDIASRSEVYAVTHVASQNLEDLDGDYLVYSDDRNSTSTGRDIYSFDLRTMTEQAVSVAAGNQTEPVVSGTRVAWEQIDALGNLDIYAGDVFGGTPQRITSHPATQIRPAISGDLLVWQDARNGGNPDIFGYWFSTPGTAFGVAGENAIATGTERAQNPDVSGTRVVWDQQASGSAQKDIYLYDFATGVITQLTSDASDQQRPRISGDLIVWEDERNILTGNGMDLYGYDLSTGTEIAFVASAAWEFLQDVDVRADGGYDIAYTVDQGGGNTDIYVLRATITADPTPTPTPEPTPEPTPDPTPDPTPEPTPDPTPEPTPEPTPTRPEPTPTPTPPPASGDACDPGSGAPVYFAETFDRSNGQPAWATRSFTAPEGPATMCLTLEHVSAAWVELNGGEVFGPSAFNADAIAGKADVVLASENELAVKLAGKPCCPDEPETCSRMTVRIVGPAAAAQINAIVIGNDGQDAFAGESTAAHADGSGDGGGCSVTPRAGGSPLAGLLLLGLVALTGRRRR